MARLGVTGRLGNQVLPVCLALRWWCRDEWRYVDSDFTLCLDLVCMSASLACWQTYWLSQSTTLASLTFFLLQQLSVVALNEPGTGCSDQGPRGEVQKDLGDPPPTLISIQVRVGRCQVIPRLFKPFHSSFGNAFNSLWLLVKAQQSWPGVFGDWFWNMTSQLRSDPHGWGSTNNVQVGDGDINVFASNRDNGWFRPVQLVHVTVFSEV